MLYLKQSTASTVVLGPFVDDGDGVTTEEALAIAQADIRLSKNGGAFAQTNNAAGATHMENGYYSVPLNTTDTNTLGRLTVTVSEAGALLVWREYHVIIAHWFDTMFASDYLHVDTIQIEGTDATTVLDTQIDDRLDTAIPGAPTANSIFERIKTMDDAYTATRGGYLDELAAANMPSDLDDVLVDTAEIGAAGVGLSAVPWNANWDTEVESEVTDSLVAHNLDHLALTATGGADMTTEVADNTILSRVLANGDTSAFDPATDGLQPIRDRGDAEWDTATGFSTHSAANVTTDMDANSTQLAAIVADTNELQSDDIPTLIAALNDISAADVNAQVLDVLNVDTFAELASVPAAAATVTQMLRWLFLLARNKVTQTSTTQIVKADDGSTTVGTSTVSDDATTATRGEFV